MSKEVASRQTIFLDKPPCCLEFCPFSPQYFVVGTYNLVKPNSTDADEDDPGEDLDVVLNDPKLQKRNGSLSLFMVKENHMYRLRTIDTSSAILDIKFAPRKELPRNSSIFAVATSTGSVCLYGCFLDEEQGGPGLWLLDECLVADEKTVITSLHFDPVSNNRICVTQSDGKVKIINTPINLWFPRPSRGTNNPFSWPLHPKSPSAIEEISTHELEAWTACHTPKVWQSQGVWSGGDDAVLRFTPVTEPSSSGNPIQEAQGWLDRKIHGAGVTAILPIKEQYIATGSYDDHFRILRLPDDTVRRPQVLHEINLGGGVWRLRMYDQSRARSIDIYRLVVCCMYEGACLLTVQHDVANDIWSSEVTARFKGHESMCYGADVLAGSRDGDDLRTFVTCSFYDKRLCLWQG